jgi:hypothetical protein
MRRRKPIQLISKIMLGGGDTPEVLSISYLKIPGYILHWINPL